MSVNNSYNLKYNSRPNTSNLDRLNKLTDKLNVILLNLSLAWTTKKTRNLSS